MSRKLIAVLTVLLMIAAPLVVVGYSEATTADANAADDITLDNLLEQTTANNYWVKATKGTDNVVTLSNNPGKTAGGVLTLSSTDKTIKTVKIAQGFIIPAEKTIICKKTLDAKTGFVLTVDKDLLVRGTIAGVLKMNGDRIITFDGANIGTTDEKGTDINCRIRMDNELNDMKLVLKNNTIIKGLYVMEYSSVEEIGYYQGIFMKNLKANNVDMNCIVSKPTNADYGWDISGNITRASIDAEAIIELGLKDEAGKVQSNSEGYNFSDLTLSNLTLKLNYKCTQSIKIYDNRKIIDYTSCKLQCSVDVFDLIKAGRKEVKMLIFNYVGEDGKQDGQIVYTAIDNTGIAGYNFVKTFATEGIASIDSRINFVPMEEGFIDLTTINVTCEAGYKFVGWYYMDANGVMCKIMNPEHVLVTDNLNVYAVAEKVIPAPEQKDYTLWFVLVSILLVVMILAVLLMAFMRSNASSASAAKPARKTSKRK